MTRVAFAVLLACCMGAAAFAQGTTIVVVEPYAGARERATDRIDEAFGETLRITGFADGAVAAEPFSGRVLLQRFDNPDGRSTLEVLENYRAALEARGYVVAWDCAGRAACGNQSDGGWNRRNGMNLGIGGDVRYVTGSLPHAGGEVYVSVGVERATHYIQVLQRDAMEGGLVRVTDAEAMAGALDATGRIAVEDIYFDFASAALLPESDAALGEIARLLADRPALTIYVVGHTDAIGTLEANLGLSHARARAVVEALETRFGVAPGRSAPAGVGPLAPVASNATEEGRAMNRRVEVVAR